MWRKFLSIFLLKTVFFLVLELHISTFHQNLSILANHHFKRAQAFVLSNLVPSEYLSAFQQKHISQFSNLSDFTSVSAANHKREHCWLMLRRSIVWDDYTEIRNSYPLTFCHEKTTPRRDVVSRGGSNNSSSLSFLRRGADVCSAATTSEWHGRAYGNGNASYLALERSALFHFHALLRMVLCYVAVVVVVSVVASQR